MTDIIKSLQWRYATKKFNTEKKVSEADLEELLEVLRLAPSSFGLQPWKFVVVKNTELRAKLKEAAWNQSQVVDASHFIVLCARTDVDENFVKRFVELISKTQEIPVENLKTSHDTMVGSLSRMDEPARLDWSKKQVYIALGMLLEAAALKGIDACPMEGFSKEKFDEILNLKEENAAATVACALGYRSEDDRAASRAKVRFAKDDIVVVK